jgi:vacuolar protein-sorting-associated protein 4
VVGALATERDPGARRRLVEGGLRHFMVRADDIRTFLAAQSEAGGAREGGAAEAGRPSAPTIVGLSRGWEQVGAPAQQRRWRSLFGLSDARAFVREQVILGCRFPELMSERRSRERPRDFKGALLHGPRGVGKSLLLQGLAELLAPLAPRCRVWQLRMGELVSQEGGEERLRKVFSEAVARRDAGELQSVLLLDDLDLVNSGEEERGRPVGTQRGGRKLRLDPAIASRVKEELMLAMRHVAREYDGLFVIAATDRPWAIDAALR